MNQKNEWNGKKVNFGSAVLVSAIVAVLGLVVGLNWNSIFGGVMPYYGFGQNAGSGLDWSSLNTLYNKVAESYNGDIDTDDLIDGAKKGMIDSLGDIYTTYMTAEDSSDFYDDLHGNVGAGIGVEMGMRDGYVRVLRLLPDNPALKAGLMIGDIFYKVNGEEVYTMSSDEIASKVRGEAGTEVTITVVRDGKEKEFTLTRETINNVSAFVNYDGSTAIITLTRFDDDTGKKVEQMTKEFAEKGINKVILDLRGNGGGYVSAARDLLSLWLDGKKILTQKSKHFGDVETTTESGKAVLKDMKTVVIVNASTASASEIVAGALQDYGIATIIGEKTFGKGVVQSLYTLGDGGTLKVTTAAWYTPKDRTIDGEGITPDIEVERTYEDINKMKDPQLDKAKAL